MSGIRPVYRGSILLCLFALSGVARDAQADFLAVSWDFVDSPVFRIDEASGTGTQVGTSGFRGLNSLARSKSGEFYSVSTVVGPLGYNMAAELVTIDPRTGSGTSIAPIVGMGDAEGPRALAFSPDDRLFAITRDELRDEDRRLYEINTTTGEAVFRTTITEVVNPKQQSIQALTFSPDGILYGWDTLIDLVEIDVQSGTSADVNLALGFYGMQTLAFAPDGTLYGAAHELYTINMTTGEAILVGSGGYFDIRGMEYIPEPTTLSLLILGSLTLLRQRRSRL